MRNFTITRLPDKELSFLHNNVRVNYVGTCPETGISFYCSILHNYGVRVYPDGQAVQVNATYLAFSASYRAKYKKKTRSQQHYLQFNNAFAHHRHIYVSHAVWMAAGRTIPEGMTMDHINGCTADNRIQNLRCIDLKTNMRDGGFLRKLRNKGIDPTTVDKSYLLRYFARMARIKETLTARQYRNLDRTDLTAVLYQHAEGLSCYFATFNNIQIYFDL